jgi:hypothetical protein
LALVGGLVLLAGWAVAARDAARHARALAEAAARPATVRLERGVGLAVPANTTTAASVLAALIADRSSAAGIALSAKPLAIRVVPGFATVDIEARGREEALRQLAQAIEGERPVIRFVRWSIQPAGDGLLRLEARAVAPLGPAPIGAAR